MIKSSKLAALFTAAVLCTSLSAFAESRHREATDRRSDDSSWRDQRDRSQQRNDAQRNDAQRNEPRRDQSRNVERHDSSASTYNNNRNDVRRNDNDRHDGSRNDSAYRNGGSYRNDGRRYSTSGRVTRVEHYGGGYRVWVGGGYPFYIPEQRWHRHPLRVGVSIVLGGVWNAGGYYDAYDYDGPYGYNTRGDLRGVVESVDYRRGTVVLRDDISGSFVTTVLRGRDPRFGDLRPGDYVELGGEWSRAGVFNAYDVLNIGDGRYGDGYGRY